MSFKRLLDEGKIRPHKSSRQEIGDLFAIVERDLKDAALKGLSADRRFVTAYNAVLQAATALMHCMGYRAIGAGHHATTFEFLRAALGKEFEERIDYFDRCRIKRNMTDYDRAGVISEKEANDLLEEARQFSATIREIIGRRYRRFSPNAS